MFALFNFRVPFLPRSYSQVVSGARGEEIGAHDEATPGANISESVAACQRKAGDGKDSDMTVSRVGDGQRKRRRVDEDGEEEDSCDVSRTGNWVTAQQRKVNEVLPLDSTSQLLAAREKGLRRQEEDLIQREKKLVLERAKLDSNAQKLKNQQGILEARVRDVDTREKALRECEALVDVVKIVETATDHLEVLQRDWACSICLGIVSGAYTSTPPCCDHVFCALCLVKYLLSSACACGEWHKQLQCPFCRADLPSLAIATEHASSPFNFWRDIPENNHYFDPHKVRPEPKRITPGCDIADACPFTPNGSLDRYIKNALDNVASLIQNTSCNPSAQVPFALQDWLSKGRERDSWERRKRIGRDHLQLLITQWRRVDLSRMSQGLKGVELYL